MNLYFRLLFLLIQRIFFFKSVDPFKPCKSKFFVNFFDLDINFHMNNGRYLSIMDLARVDLLLKSHMFWKLVINGYYPVVVSESIRFKKSLELFHKFEIITVIESWDDKDFFISQKFIRTGTIYAEGYIKGRFKQRGRKASVPTTEIFHFLGKTYTHPHLSPKALAQNSIENQLLN